MMSYGYNPLWSEGAIKCPIFQTSTFAFQTAEEGKAFFEVAYGLRERNAGEKTGLIYSRINNPDLQILEERLALWDNADICAVFESGMSAITTVFLEFLKPGDVLLYGSPVYGGTDHFIEHFLPTIGVEAIPFGPHDTRDDIMQMIQSHDVGSRVRMVFFETPANPTNDLFDIAMCASIASELSKPGREVLTVVDNTYLGPVWQHPLKHGADLVVYSATKYIGGHSDVIAGAVLGGEEYMTRIKNLRTFLGNMAGPWTGWLLMRSLETLKLRMTRQAANARSIVEFLVDHPAVEKVHFPGIADPGSRQEKIFKSQCESAGAMISFEIRGGEKEAFEFMNALELFKIAVSLGGTESLAQHPRTMTHAGIPEHMQDRFGISRNLVRLSIGVEHPDDILSDLEQALASVEVPVRKMAENTDSLLMYSES